MTRAGVRTPAGAVAGCCGVVDACGLAIPQPASSIAAAASDVVDERLVIGP